MRFNTCFYFKVESKITRDFAAECSMFTYKQTRLYMYMCNQMKTSLVYIAIIV